MRSLSHTLFLSLSLSMQACASANYGGQQSYGSGGQESYGSGGQQSYSSSSGGDDASAAAAAGGAGGELGPAGGLGDAAGAGAGADASGLAHAGQSSYGSDQNIPYKPVNTKGNTLTSAITYPQNKGEILIHRPAPIIVRRPPTKVLVNHPPLVVKPAPVVLHKPPAIVLRKVYVKHHPRRVKVEPVFVNVVKPPAEKYFVNENKQGYGQEKQGYGNGQNQPIYRSRPIVAPGGPALPAYASGADSAAASAGYQLLQGGNHGLSALANIAGERDANAYGAHSQQQYGPQSQPAQGGYSAPAY